MKDFFISYNKADKNWAEWVAWILEEAEYSTVLQAWDFRPGGNFVLEMNRASIETKKTIAILSEDYIEGLFTQSEWTAAFVQDPNSREGRLIPIRVQECRPTGLLASIIYVDVIGLSEQDAHAAILGAFRPRAKPAQSPPFPGGAGISRKPEPRATQRVSYPGPAESDESITARIGPHLNASRTGDIPSARRELIHYLRTTSAQEFNILVSVLKPPPEVIPSMPTLHQDRVRTLLNWAEGEGGCGLANLHNVLYDISNP